MSQCGHWVCDLGGCGPGIIVVPEDKSLLRIVLVKAHREASNCWKSLLKGQYEGSPLELDQMEKKLTLERFQTEVPHMVHRC